MKGNVLITGAAGNLGKAAVIRFAQAGYRVIAITEPGSDLAFDVPESVLTFPVDLRDEFAVAEFIKKTVSDFHTIDVALLLVGGFAAGGISTTTGEDLRRMFALNFETAYFTARPVFERMMNQEHGGRIVFVGARPVFEPEAGRKFMAYTLSKSLLFKLAEVLNAEGGAKNVVSSVIVPSTIDTPANRSSMPSADFTKWVLPEQIAEIMQFITSDQAKPLAGSVLKIYGNS